MFALDKDTQDLVKVTTQGVAQGATTAFLSTLFGPAVEAIAILTDEVRMLRWKRQAKMLARANAHLDALGLRPTAISLKLLVPLLEYASLEDESDEAMVDRWAALLANAAAGRHGAAMLPSFPRILSELSSEEVVVLDTLYRDATRDDMPTTRFLHVPESGLSEGDPQFIERCYNLDRLGLVHASWENVPVAGSDPRQYRHTIAHLEGTALGISFVLACNPPGSIGA